MATELESLLVRIDATTESATLTSGPQEHFCGDDEEDIEVMGDDIKLIDETRRAAGERAWRAALLEMNAAGINDNDALGVFLQLSTIGLVQHGLPVEEIHATVDRMVERLDEAHPYSRPQGRA